MSLDMAAAPGAVPSAVPAVIESREHLVAMLAEAAEIEHNLMCCYLYAAFSLKEGLDEGLTEVELAAVQRWRRAIIGVAIDEMAHLALVANLTSAVGGVPHFGRANFPIPAGYHPAGIVVKLAPFNAETLEHFIYLERPESAQIADGAGFEPERRYQRIAATAGRLMPSSGDYETIGELYHAIRDGLVGLVERDGERAIFLGDPAHQIGPEVASLPGMTRVRCLKTARAALDGIVIQGEGAPGHSESSHYQRFLEIRGELQRLRAARPDFEPARPAAHNPVMRHPSTPEGKVWVMLQPAADLLDLVNASYIHMLRLLVQAYAEPRGPGAQGALVDAAIAMMYAVSPVASGLTRLSANPDNPGVTAGMSFATIRGNTALPSGPPTDAVLIERSREIARGAARLAEEMPRWQKVAARLAQVAEQLATGLAASSLASVPLAIAPAPPARPAAAPPPPPAPTAGVPASVVVDGIESVEGRALTLRFEAKRCIHARHCVLMQPGVFKANVVGPWLDPDATTTEGLVTVAHMCPSGAIQYRRKDGGPEEAAPPVNLVQLRENGPLGVRAELYIDGVAAGFRATLCRCGASQRKPFCDGSHATAGFIASAEPATRASEPLATRNGRLDVRPQPNGPLVVRGNLELCAGTGRTIDRVTETRLCRCGHSENKPFCDGSHARVGFIAD
jgi:CDGSH-type Zn-finger protein/uncharacterized Fe-S cluster protein YjdI